MKLAKLSDKSIKVLTTVLFPFIFPLDEIKIKSSLSEHVEEHWERLIPVPDELRDKLKELGVVYYKLVSDTNYSASLGRAEIILKIADKE